MRYTREEARKWRAERLGYMQSLLGQLRSMAEAERCDMLAYLVERAYFEVSDIIRDDAPLGVEDEGNRTARMALKAPGKIKFQ